MSDLLSTAPGLVGHQVVVDWFGRLTLTLADLWPDSCRAVIVGVNPAPRSVAVGHYYQGANGRTALKRLRSVGLLPLGGGGPEDDEAFAAGVGFTDLVKRPTRAATDLSRAELDFGRTRLGDELAAREVPLVVCVFGPAAKAVLGRAVPPGLHYDDAGRVVFRMPGPYAPGADVAEAMRQLDKHLTGPGGQQPGI